jgi:cobalt-zinc-cadmium efflux system outer membrane protein
MRIVSLRVAGAVVALASWAAGLPAQQLSSVVTLRAIYRAVDSASPSIRAADAVARAAASRVPGASRLPDPRLQLQLMNRNLPGLGLNDPLGMNQLQVTQMVPIAGKLGVAGKVAEARADAARESVGEVIWSRRASAAAAFFELHRLDVTLAITRETLRLLEGIGTSVTQLYAVGEARQADVLRAQLETNRMSGEVEDLTRLRAATAARLNAVLNRPVMNAVGATEMPDFPDHLPPLDSLVARAFASRGMLRSATADLQAATESERLARREIWPDLEVGLVYGQRGMADGTTDRMISLMFGATVPIWAKSRQFRMRDEAAAMRDMADADLDALRADTRGRVAELAAQLDGTTRLRGLYARSILPQAEATAQSARGAYQAGTVDFMTMLDALMVVNTYRQKLQQLGADAGTALAELEMLTGSPLIPGTPPIDHAGKGGTL